MPGKSRGREKYVPMKGVVEPQGVMRMEIDEEGIEELAANIAERGLLQAIVVRLIDEGHEIIAGHRRYLAVKRLGWETIPARVVELDDVDTFFARASENLSRKDLTVIEEGAIYHEMKEVYGLTLNEVAEKMGKTAGLVRRRIDLVSMPPDLQEAVHVGLISYSVAEQLWSLKDVEAISYYLSYAIDHGCTQNVARGWVRDWRRSKEATSSGTDEGSPPAGQSEPRPYYTSCDLCGGPAEVSEIVHMRICLDCKGRIDAAK